MLKPETLPTVLPLDISAIKEHEDIEHSADDSLLAIYLATAVNLIQERIERQLVSSVWKLSLDKFPVSRMPHNSNDGLHSQGRAILLRRLPVQEVIDIKYIDGAGTEQTLAAADYLVDLESEPARI